MTVNDCGLDDDALEAMLPDFLDESAGYLAVLNARLLELDDCVKAVGGGPAPTDRAVLNEMFRAAHSLKGMSAMLRLNSINKLTHRMENVFDAARNDHVAVDGEVIDIVFQALDCLSALIDQLVDPQLPAPGSDEVVEKIQQFLQRNRVSKEVCSQEALAAALAAAQSAAASPAAEQGSADDGQPAPPAADPVGDEEAISEKYLAIYVDEAGGALEELSEALLAPADVQASPRLLATCHRLKGSSASLGLNRAARLVHALEDALQRHAPLGSSIPAWLVDAALACVDALRDYVDQLRTGGAARPDFARALAALDQGDLGAAAAGRRDPAPAAVAAAQRPGPCGDELSAELRGRIAAAAPPGARGFAAVVELETGLPLADVKLDLLFRKLDDLGRVFFRDPPASETEAVAEIHVAIFALATDSSAETVAAALAVDGVCRCELTNLAALGGAPPRAASQPPVVARSSPSTEAVGARPAAPAGDGPSPPKAGDSRKKPAETVRVEIDRLDELMNLAGQLVISRARFSQISDSLRSLGRLKHTSHGVGNLASAVDALEELVDSCHDGAPARDALSSLKHHARRMRDDLAAVLGELQTLTQLPRSVVDLGEAVHQLGRIADGLQKGVMDTRMLPIGPLFGRFKRVIRDITRGNGREIALEIAGENTELDKRMIDELGDPLIHLVRNAADHGIESPAERVAAGKPPQGSVFLNAFHRGNQIVIQVRDDGRGIDPAKVRRKAVEKGLLSVADAEKLTDGQALQLIWEPGFSTADRVTEVSGRGMGMDIVKTKIEDLNGSVEVDSRMGEGAAFTIKLPLTLAILPSLLAEIDGDAYAIPIESVLEIVQINAESVSTIGGRPCARIRDRVVAMASLAEVYAWSNPPQSGRWQDDRDNLLVICGVDRREVALIVDHVLGEDDVVIKSLAENYQSVEGVSGASLLGDGRVSLILDVNFLLDRALSGPQCGSDAARSTPPAGPRVS